MNYFVPLQSVIGYILLEYEKEYCTLQKTRSSFYECVDGIILCLQLG